MIIQNDVDWESVQTLVPLPTNDSSSASAVSKPATLSALMTSTLISYSVSIPLFAFGLNHLSFSRAQAIPGIVAFGVGFPFYIATTIVMCSQTRRHRISSKIIIIIYIVLLQALWLYSAIESGLVLSQTWNHSPQFPTNCISPNPNAGPDPPAWNFVCYRDSTPRVTLFISGILALIEVITLGVIIKIIIKLDITQSNTDALHHPSSHPSKPFTVAVRFLGPLTYASLGFSIPPLVTAFHHISNPSLKLVVVPAITTSVLTSLFLTVNLYLKRVHPESASSTKGRSIEMPIPLLLLSAGWLACTGTGFCTLKTPDLLRTICPDDIALPLVKSACRTNLQDPLRLHVVWTSLQMLILASMALLYYVINSYTDSNASNSPESSIPQQRAVAKGPRMAF